MTTINAGTLILAKTAGINAIAGNVTIGNASGGVDTLQLAGSDQIANSAVLTFNGTGTSAGRFRLAGNNDTIGGITSTGDAGIVENGVSGSSTLTVDTTAARDFSGILQNGAAGTLALTKDGASSQTLSGTVVSRTPTRE